MMLLEYTTVRVTSRRSCGHSWIAPANAFGAISYACNHVAYVRWRTGGSIGMAIVVAVIKGIAQDDVKKQIEDYEVRNKNLFQRFSQAMK